MKLVSRLVMGGREKFKRNFFKELIMVFFILIFFKLNIGISIEIFRERFLFS